MEESILARLTSECREQFEEGLSYKQLMINEWCENRQADFNLWIASLGVLSEGHASLNWRLRDRSDVHDAIVTILEQLKDSLDACVNAALNRSHADSEYVQTQTITKATEALAIPDHSNYQSTHSGKLSPWSDLSEHAESVTNGQDSFPMDGSLESAMQDTEIILDQLTRISVAIRTLGSRLRYEKADRTLDPDKYQDLIRHLTLVLFCESTDDFARLCAQLPEFLTPSALLNTIQTRLIDQDWLTPIHRRLIAANLKRHHRFVWARKHEYMRSKLLESGPPVAQPNPLPMPINPPDARLTLPPVQQPGHDQGLKGSLDQNPRLVDESTYSATNLGSHVQIPHVPSTRAASNVTKMSATGTKVHYPPQPRLEGDRKVFECPFCCQVLPSKYARKGWRGHVQQDIQPYVCIFETCNKSEQLFVSSEKWQQHMEEEHAMQKWICSVCKSDQVPEFSSEQALLDHLQSTEDHADSFTQAQLPIIIRGSKRSLPLNIDSCPLCQYSNQHDEKSVPLIDHIAHHLHEFALRALPWDSMTEDTRTVAQLQDSGEDLLSGRAASSLQEEDMEEDDFLSLVRNEARATEQSLQDALQKLEKISVQMLALELLNDSKQSMIDELKLCLEEFDLAIFSAADSMIGATTDQWIRANAALRRVQQLSIEVTTYEHPTLSREQFNTVREQLEAESVILHSVIRSILRKRAKQDRDLRLKDSSKLPVLGFTEVFCAANPMIDIVFVHGLYGHPYHTWTTRNKLGSEVFWPCDLLPRDIKGLSPRILVYGYESSSQKFADSASEANVYLLAEQFTARLVANRKRTKASERPIIFVAHSLGGLLVKRSLLFSKGMQITRMEHIRSIYVSTNGILFLGTPHIGSDVAKGAKTLKSIMSAVVPKGDIYWKNQVVQDIGAQSELLQNINRSFIDIITTFHLYFFFEGKPTDMHGTRQFVVDEDSAAPILPGIERATIEADHTHMCKFADENAPGYDLVAEAIQRYAYDANTRVASRWQVEKRFRQYQRQQEARELLQLNASDDSINRFGKTGTTALLDDEDPGMPLQETLDEVGSWSSNDRPDNSARSWSLDADPPDFEAVYDNTNKTLRIDRLREEDVEPMADTAQWVQTGGMSRVSESPLRNWDQGVFVSDHLTNMNIIPIRDPTEATKQDQRAKLKNIFEGSQRSRLATPRIYWDQGLFSDHLTNMKIIRIRDPTKATKQDQRAKLKNIFQGSQQSTHNTTTPQVETQSTATATATSTSTIGKDPALIRLSSTTTNPQTTQSSKPGRLTSFRRALGINQSEPSSSKQRLNAEESLAAIRRAYSPNPTDR